MRLLGLGIGAIVRATAPAISIIFALVLVPFVACTFLSGAASAGLDNVCFERGDAQVHGLPEAGFDAVVSRFGVMFFDDPHAAFANLARSLRSGGRVVFACWQDLVANEWLMVPAGAALAYVPMPDLGEPGDPVRSPWPNPDASGPFSRASASST